MNIPRMVRFFSALCATTAFGAEAPDNLPVWLRALGNPHPGSVEVFDAFHSQASGPERLQQSVPAPIRNVPAIYPNEFRTIDGTGNNPINPLLGVAETPLLRQTTPGYGDGVGSPAGADRLSAREISNLVNAQATLLPNSTNVSGFFFQWGQFVDHDMGLNRVSKPAEIFNIPVPLGDPQFDPGNTGTKALPFQRSSFVVVDGIREQVNVNSGFIDGSMVYGSGVQLSRELRTNDGTGHLKTSDKNLLPFNINGFPNQPAPTASFFLAGDVRANENAGLLTMQTLFMREHNFWADSIKAGDPTLKDSDIYFRARAIVGAEIQLITYRDFLPLLLGPDALPPYAGYNSDVDPSVSNEFSVAAFRLGHSLLPPVFMRLDARNQSIGDLPLGGTFFEPVTITTRGIDPYLRGLAKQIPQEVDAYIIDAVRCFLIGGVVGAGGFDLAALNIQRGRDHGVAGYNQVRLDLGLPAKTTFADMTPDPDLQAKLMSAYSSPDDVDFWVGGLVEPHVPGAQVGETFFTILRDQFQRTRDGDRFWYEAYLDPVTLAIVQQQTLTTIIQRNTRIRNELQADVFHVP
jgi:peroxidase